MAALSATVPTLLDLKERMDPNDKIAAVIEILAQQNEIIQDIPFMEGNLTTGHMTTIRTGIPTPTWRKINQGVTPSKSTTAQVQYNTGMMEQYAEVDKKLADLNGNTSAFRLSEDRAFIEGMNQEFASTLFYGNETTEPEAFTGLSPYFNDLTAESADNMISGGGSSGQTDCGSIWLIVWGENTAHGLYPKGSVAGLQMEDLGEQTLETTAGVSGARSQIYRTHYMWNCGLAIRDWRFAVRIHSIDKSTLIKAATSGADLPDLMFQALNLPPSLNMGRPVFYMARDMRTMLFRQTSAATSSSTLRTENVGGTLLTTFHGVPIRRCDALAGDETSLN